MSKKLLFVFIITAAVLFLSAKAIPTLAQTIDPTVKALQDQIQLLLSQMQALQQQVTSLQAGSASQTPTLTAPTTKPSTIIPPTSSSDLDIDESEISESETEFIPPPTLTRSLKRGSRGEDVKQLQEFLAQDSTIYPEGLATGYYGIGTEAAVKKWQAKNGLPSVGAVGRQTISKFKEIYSGVVSGLRQQEDRADTSVSSRPTTTAPKSVPPTAEDAAKTKKEICPALPTVDSCLAGEERVVAYKSEQCGVYYGCKTRTSTRADNTIAFLKKVSSIQTDSRYNIVLNDPEGIQKFAVYNAKGAEIHSGYPACRTDWTSPTISAESSEFPLKLALTDCGSPSSQFSIALTAPIVIQPVSRATTFPYTFSNGKTVYSSDEARTYCYANGPGSGQGIAAECETKFGISYTTLTPVATTTTSTASNRAYYLTAVFETCMTKYGFNADAKQVKAWAQAADPIPWQNLSGGAQTSVSACEREYYGVQTSPMTTATSTATTQTTTLQQSSGQTAIPPAGQKEQIWNSLGLRSWIRTDADSARIEQLKQACVNVPTGANIWSPNAGVSTSPDFGMPSADKCRLAAACSSTQYFNGTTCVSGTSTYYPSTSTASCADRNSNWPVQYGSYCLNSSRTQYVPLSSPMTSSGQPCTGNNSPIDGCTLPGGGGSTILSCSASVPEWPVQYGNYCLNSSRTQYVPLSSPVLSSAQSCAGNNSPVDGCTTPGGSTTTTTATGSCSQYGSGWHIMGDNNCYDANMTNYRTANGTLYSCSATPSSGCSSGSSTTSSNTSCGFGYYWSGSSCMSSSTATGSSCSSGQYWNGSACVTSTAPSTSCSGGQYWNGTACVVSPGYTDQSTACAQAGGSWNTSSSYCQMPTASGSSTSSTSSTSCSSGQYWNGSNCVSSTPSSSSSTTCPSGNYWNGSACVPSPTTSTSCSGGQYWNGTACVSSTPPTSAISNPALASIIEILNEIIQKVKVLIK